MTATDEWDCDFENGICSYTQAKDDTFDWTRDAGGTSSGGTGPSKDHTLGTSKYLIEQGIQVGPAQEGQVHLKTTNLGQVSIQ